eukprot:TRINITY_DN25285_c0_g1_i1.p1 TRINITY_DN25285_c0_g1~~TRINITY_DN25285_c0_g1_i1.p1  ORF type:complete len:313 (+),score=25.35 TRINITY_DN25285_c0_g1_i1:197-1135(+)
MFTAENKYLSRTAQIFHVKWTGEPFETVFTFQGLNFIIKCEKSVQSDSLKLIFQIQNQNQPYLTNNNYTVFLQKNDQERGDGIITNLKNDKQVNMSVNVQRQNQQEYPQFLKKWCVQLEGKEDDNYLQVHFWQNGDPDEEKRCLELTDCMLHAKIDSANVCVLASSSEVIFNMINDLNQSYSPKNPLNLDTLFKNFQVWDIHLYLCCVYNPNFLFFWLSDIMGVLEIAVKLENQTVISRIMNMEQLGRIVRDQILTDEKFIESRCYIKNVLDFASKHCLNNLTVFCQLIFFSTQNEDASGMMKNLFEHYQNM